MTQQNCANQASASCKLSLNKLQKIKVLRIDYTLLIEKANCIAVQKFLKISKKLHRNDFGLPLD